MELFVLPHIPGRGDSDISHRMPVTVPAMLHLYTPALIVWSWGNHISSVPLSSLATLNWTVCESQRVTLGGETTSSLPSRLQRRSRFHSFPCKAESWPVMTGTGWIGGLVGVKNEKISSGGPSASLVNWCSLLIPSSLRSSDQQATQPSEVLQKGISSSGRQWPPFLFGQSF